MKKKPKNKTIEAYLKANRKASRELKKEFFGNGFKASNRIHKSKKIYNRKNKNNE